MLAQLADLRFCALMSLLPYVLRPFVCALMSAALCPAPFCLRPYVGFRSGWVHVPRNYYYYYYYFFFLGLEPKFCQIFELLLVISSCKTYQDEVKTNIYL